jgi:hypothetical protein
MKRTAHVARTAYDLKHLNRLRVPEFWIVSIHLTSSGKSSNCYLPDDAPQTGAGGGSDDYHFVPEKETIQLTYELDDPLAMIQSLKLELFRRFHEPPLWTLDLAKLGPDALVNGKHTLKFDGRVSQDPAAEQAGTASDQGMQQDLTALAADETIVTDFPDGYITIEHSPYKLRLTASDGEATPSIRTAWTYFHILLKKLELELGPVEAVETAGVSAGRQALDQKLYQAVKDAGGLPASGAAARQIFAISNIFKLSSAEMNDNTGFTEYQTVWDDGPRIPVIAKIRLLASDDSEVKLEDGPGAKALGKVKFLWDWEDTDPNGTQADAHQSQAAPKAFLKDSINYFRNGTDPARAAKDHTYPKGSNCHVDRKGKRGPDAVSVFPAGPGYATQKPALDEQIFPFQVEVCNVRKWASFSYAWTKGKMIGQTGVLFRPARMGGDNYKIAVYLAYETKLDNGKEVIVLDVKDEPLVAPAALKADTGPFQTWRELHITRYIRKKNSIAEFVTANLAAIQALYHEPYVEVLDKMGAGDRFELPTAGYNAAATGALGGSGDAMITQNLCVDAAADHSSTASSFLTRTFAAFVAQVNSTFNTPANPNGGANWLNTHGISNQMDYVNKLKSILTAPSIALVSALNTLTSPTTAADGITIIQFDQMASEQAVVVRAAGVTDVPGMSIINGAALDVPGNSRNRCCFAFWNARVDTFVHEIGHHLFLPHSQNAGGEQPLRHDSADAGCIMSYNRPRPAFCGLCQLRLRGWDAGPNSGSAILKNVAAQNKKP